MAIDVKLMAISTRIPAHNPVRQGEPMLLPRLISCLCFLIFCVMGGSQAGYCQAVDVEGLTKQMAATPPMGWNSWNHFAEKITDSEVRAAADAMVASGMRDAGYRYVVIDDGWQGQRDAQGIIHPHCCPGKILGREDKPCRFCTIHGLHGKNDLKC
jgi:hypothetical protein